jgi:hypothetical protein
MAKYQPRCPTMLDWPAGDAEQSRNQDGRPPKQPHRVECHQRDPNSPTPNEETSDNRYIQEKAAAVKKE